MGVHDGHRARLKGRFLEHGLDSFNELNALELVLFYAIPRRDTNEIAHALIERFGSLAGVMDASYHELLEIPGVGESAATLITMIPQLMRKAEMSKADSVSVIRNANDAGKYLVPRFLHRKEEHLLLLCLDSRKRIISCTELNSGVVNAVDTSVRKIVETALRCRACSAILAHNHPDGLALPSREDDYMTRQAHSSLALVGIELVDHIVVAGNDFVSYSESGYFNMIKF